MDVFTGAAVLAAHSALLATLMYSIFARDTPKAQKKAHSEADSVCGIRHFATLMGTPSLTAFRANAISTAPFHGSGS